jgi:hypothetical protein
MPPRGGGRSRPSERVPRERVPFSVGMVRAVDESFALCRPSQIPALTPCCFDPGHLVDASGRFRTEQTLAAASRASCLNAAKLGAAEVTAFVKPKSGHCHLGVRTARHGPSSIPSLPAAPRGHQKFVGRV